MFKKQFEAVYSNLKDFLGIMNVVGIEIQQPKTVKWIELQMTLIIDLKIKMVKVNEIFSLLVKGPENVYQVQKTFQIRMNSFIVLFKHLVHQKFIDRLTIKAI